MMDQPTREAIDRIARTADGQALYRYLQQELCQVISPPNESALREQNGRRSFAHDLMGHMAEGIDASVRSEPVTIPRRAAAGTSRRLTVREYAASLPSWTDDPGTERPGTA